MLCASGAAQDFPFAAMHLLNALPQVFPVEDGLIFQPMPHVLQKVPVQAVIAKFAQNLADHMDTWHVEQEPGRPLPCAEQASSGPGTNGLLAQSEDYFL